VTYVLFPDEGHGFARPENSLAFFAVAEAFLAEHLGGRYEPIGNDFNGSTITVPEGEAGVPGLKEALAQQPKPPETPEAPEVLKHPEAPAAPKPQGAPNPETPEAPKSDKPEAPKASETPEAPKPSETSETPKPPAQ
jgi:hypothetical protein